MSTALSSAKRALLSVSAVAATCAAAGYIIYKRRKAYSITVLCEEETPSPEMVSLDQELVSPTSKDTSRASSGFEDFSQPPALSWSEEVERSYSLSECFVSTPSALHSLQQVDSSIISDTAPDYCSTNDEVSRVLSLVQNFNGLQVSPSCPKNETYGESPSVASDGHSENSTDSGKGGSTHLGSGMSPLEELMEVPPLYEFEIPLGLVGLLIGAKGVAIKNLMEQSGAHIIIREHYDPESKCKICSIEGTRDEINKCLRLIRRRFPPSRFADLQLTPLLPPLITSPQQANFDASTSQLSLPENVPCEVMVSSLVSAGHFFLQQPTHPTHTSLARLDQYMLAVYSQHSGVPALPRPIEAGVICAAPVLGGWYRAQTMIAYGDPTDEVLLRFVDYGGYSKIPASDLRQIRNDFMTLPFQASECHLAYVEPVEEGEGWSDEAKAYFEQLAVHRILQAVSTGMLAEDGIPYVDLYMPVDTGFGTPESVPINRMLVDAGFARWMNAA